MNEFFASINSHSRPSYRNQLFNLNQRLAPSVGEKLFKGAELAEFDQNQVFQLEGNKIKSIFFVKKGIIRSFSDYKGREITQIFYFENEMIATFAAHYCGGKNIKNLQAITPSTVLCIDYDIARNRLMDDSELSSFYLEYLTLHLLSLYEKTAILNLPDANQKYAYLLEHFPDYIQLIKLKYIAPFLNLNMETLSRVRKKVAHQAKLSLERSH